MIINPNIKSVSYKMESLSDIEQSLNELQRLVLEDDGISGESARTLISELNLIRNKLHFSSGVSRHDKFSKK